jgi:hypothetical protein
MISFLPNLIEISAALGIYADERKMIFQKTAQVLIEGFGRVNVEERVVLCSRCQSAPPACLARTPEKRKNSHWFSGSYGESRLNQ